jgi:hypothetical protein
MMHLHQWRMKFQNVHLSSSSQLFKLHQSFGLQIGTNHFQYIMMHLEKQWGAHYLNWKKMGMTIPFILLANN